MRTDRHLCPYCGQPKTRYEVKVGGKEPLLMPVYICVCPGFKAALAKITAVGKAKEKSE